MSNSSAARTNLTSKDVRISNNVVLGKGAFRVALLGTYVGGNRNNQEAACKRFHPQFRQMEDEYFQADFQVADKAIKIAECWNRMAQADEKILITRGHIIHSRSGIPYLVEPLIRDYTKFTSNTGWIAKDGTWHAEAMEAFSHYSYHITAGRMMVCDLQGRYKFVRCCIPKSRFELTDPAICSSNRAYGPTDLGIKGMETFFVNHKCNQFCNADGIKWARPKSPSSWFAMNKGTSMLSSEYDAVLTNRNDYTSFRLNFNNIMEEEDDEDDDDDSY